MASDRPDPAPAHAAATVTGLLLASTGGNREALDQLFAIVYDELRRMARRRLLGERADHTLGATGLVHEAYCKLVRLEKMRYRNRVHFFAIAARAMHQVLVNHAIRRRTAKRGGGVAPATLDEAAAPVVVRSDEVLALDQALRRLEAEDPVQSRVVECRFFAGMSIDDTADALGISPATVKREWTMARAWLHRELGA